MLTEQDLFLFGIYFFFRIIDSIDLWSNLRNPDTSINLVSVKYWFRFKFDFVTQMIKLYSMV